MASATGSALDDELIGTDEADWLTGAGGNDHLVGAGGVDTAVWLTSLAGYRLALGADGVFTVRDIAAQNGDEGFDRLESVETLVFASRALALYGGFRLNALTSGDQSESALVRLAGGGVLALWQSRDGDGLSVRARVQGGAEFAVGAVAPDGQWSPRAARGADGRVLVVCLSGGAGVASALRGRMLDADGNPSPEDFQLAALPDMAPGGAALSALDGGGYVLLWSGPGPAGAWSLRGLRCDSDGRPQGQAFEISSGAGIRESASVTALPDGGFLACWAGEGGGDTFGVMTRRYDASGLPVAAERRVNATLADYQWSPSLAAAPDGSVLVVWQGAGDQDAGGVFARLLDPAGNAAGGEIRVNTTVAGDQRDPVVAALAGGGFVVAWISDDVASAPVVMARILNEDGSPRGGEILVSPTDGIEVSQPTLLALPGGGFLVSWTDYGGEAGDLGGRGIQARYFDSLGQGLVVGPVTGIRGDVTSQTLDLSASAAGLWIQGGDGNDALTGGAGHDRLAGGRGNDTYLLGDGDDAVREWQSQGTDTVVSRRSHVLEDFVENLVLEGTDAADGAGNTLDNLLTGNAGANVLDGRGGDDTAILAGSASEYRFGVHADGGISSARAGEAADRLYRIEHFRFADAEWRILDETPVNLTRLNSQRAPSLAVLASGAVQVAWWGYYAGDSVGVAGRLIRPDGAPGASETPFNTFQTNDQRFPSVAALRDGGSIVVWMSNTQDGSNWGIYGRKLDAAGQPSGAEFRINQTTLNSQQMPVAAGLSAGGFVTAWYGYAAGDSTGIYARCFNADGSASGAEFRVNTITTGEQRDPSVTALADGGFMLAWTTRDADGSTGVAARRFDSNGLPSGNEFAVAADVGDQGNVALVQLIDGSVVMAWQADPAPPAAAPSPAWRVNLPNVDNGSPVGGFTCTGLDRITRGPWAGAWLVGSDGRRIDSPEAAGAGEVMVLSADFSRVLMRLDPGFPGGVQGVAVDTSGPADTFWVTDGYDGWIRHYRADGVEVVADRIDYRGLTGFDPNGLAYDPVNHALWVGSVGSARFDLLACQDGARLRSVTGGADPDQLSYDAAAGILYYTTGANGSDGQVRAVVIDGVSGSFAVCGALAGVQAIEGLHVDAATGRVTVLNDGGFHAAANPALNQAVAYDLPMLTRAEALSRAGQAGADILAQRFSVSGQSLGPVLALSGLSAADQRAPALAALSDGRFVAVWQAQELDGSTTGIRARVFDASGLPEGEELTVNAYVEGIQDIPSVTALSEGGFLVAWQSQNQDGSGYGVYTRRYNALAQPVTVIDGTAAGDVLDFADSTGAVMLSGGSGNDRLGGGLGGDTLIGGEGDDTYVLDGTADLIRESAGQGRDTVWSSTDRVLGEFLENLLLTGRAAQGVGNDLDNQLTGNGLNNQLMGGGGNELLEGGNGADTLSGGTGDDSYVVDALDRILESAGQGMDTVLAAISWTLGAALENLVLTGTAAVYGTGNALDNQITGNTANNQLSGGEGQDTLSGGAGSDLLRGDAGNDLLRGGAGSDNLQGGSGSDTYLIQRGDGVDTVTESAAPDGGSDLLWFTDAGIAADQLWFRRVSQDLEVSVVGTTTRALVKGWYGSVPALVEEFRAGDGKTLRSDDVSLLVDAMAALTPPAAGNTAGFTGRSAELDSLLGIVWR